MPSFKSLCAMHVRIAKSCSRPATSVYAKTAVSQRHLAVDALRRRLLRQRTLALVAGLRGGVEQARRDAGAVEQNRDLPGYPKAVVAVFPGPSFLIDGAEDVPLVVGAEAERHRGAKRIVIAKVGLADGPQAGIGPGVAIIIFFQFRH